MWCEILRPGCLHFFDVQHSCAPMQWLIAFHRTSVFSCKKTFAECGVTDSMPTRFVIILLCIVLIWPSCTLTACTNLSKAWLVITSCGAILRCICCTAVPCEMLIEAIQDVLDFLLRHRSVKVSYFCWSSSCLTSNSRAIWLRVSSLFLYPVTRL